MCFSGLNTSRSTTDKNIISLPHFPANPLRRPSTFCSQTFPLRGLQNMSSAFHYHLFALPRELLDTLIPRNLSNQAPPPESEAPVLNTDRLSAPSRTCNICLGAVFLDVDQQRLHFRSDWHRYNVKMRLVGHDSISEVQFTKLVDGMPYDSCSPIESLPSARIQTWTNPYLVRHRLRTARTPPMLSTPLSARIENWQGHPHRILPRLLSLRCLLYGFILLLPHRSGSTSQFSTPHLPLLIICRSLDSYKLHCLKDVHGLSS